MKQLVRCILLILPLLTLAACGTKNPYKVMELKAGEDPIPLRAVVTNFEDARPHESRYNQSLTMIPLVPYGGYSLDRHDSVYSSATEPFTELAARSLAQRLDETNVFESVEYRAPDQLPAPGEYDVLVKGRINTLQSKGGITRYGLSIIGDLLWDLGVPNRSRRWAMDIDYWLEDAYDGEQLTRPYKAELTTSRSIFSKYYNYGKVEDLKKKQTPVYDAFIANLWEAQPDGDDPSWAKVRSEGEQLLAAKSREETRIRQGSPPTFSFLAPTDGSTVRQVSVPVRWSIAAPMHLRTAALVVNGEPVRLPLDKAAMDNESTAPLSIPAQEVEVPLSLGENRLEALVTDHRGNESRAAVTLTRLPRQLNPARRYALLIGTGSPEAQNGARALQQVLADPVVGQFNADDITIVTGSDFDPETISQTISTFGRKPLVDDLVVIYLAVDGEWESLKLAGTDLTLDQLVGDLRKSLATEKVVFLDDVNWTGSGGQSIDRKLKTLPRQWAFVTANSEGGPREGGRDTSALQTAVSESLKGTRGHTQRLTLERFIDEVLQTLSTSGKGAPGKYGYYSPNITMAERE